MSERQFTGEELAQDHLLHLTRGEMVEYLGNKGNSKHRRYRDHSKKLTFIRSPGKIFFIRYPDEHGVIIIADNEDDALIQAAFYGNKDDVHHCNDPYYNKSCEECVTVFEELAEKLNRSTVTWLGWGCPDYNWAINI